VSITTNQFTSSLTSISVTRQIATRCTQTWNSAPAHLRYPTCDWNDNHRVAVRIMLLSTYLIYLYNFFLIHRLLAQHDPSAEKALLDVSSEILSIVLKIGRQHEPTIDIRSDFNSIVSYPLYLFYTMPTNIWSRLSYTAFPAPVPSSKPSRRKPVLATQFPIPALEQS
jgi:hypothetical protein